MVSSLLSKVQTDRSVGDLAARIKLAMGDISQVWNTDIDTYTYAEEPMRVVGERADEVRSVLESQLR